MRRIFIRVNSSLFVVQQFGCGREPALGLFMNGEKVFVHLVWSRTLPAIVCFVSGCQLSRHMYVPRDDIATVASQEHQSVAVNGYHQTSQHIASIYSRQCSTIALPHLRNEPRVSAKKDLLFDDILNAFGWRIDHAVDNIAVCRNEMDGWRKGKLPDMYPKPSSGFGERLAVLQESGEIDGLLTKHGPSEKKDHKEIMCPTHTDSSEDEKIVAQSEAVHKGATKYDGYYEYVIFDIDHMFHTYRIETTVSPKILLPSGHVTFSITFTRILQVLGNVEGVMKVREPYIEWKCKRLHKGQNTEETARTGSTIEWFREYQNPEIEFVMRYKMNETSVLYTTGEYSLTGFGISVGRCAVEVQKRFGVIH